MAVTISCKIYGMPLAKAVAWVMSRLGASDEQAMRAAMRCLVLRQMIDGRTFNWLWLRNDY